MLKNYLLLEYLWVWLWNLFEYVVSMCQKSLMSLTIFVILYLLSLLKLPLLFTNASVTNNILLKVLVFFITVSVLNYDLTTGCKQ